MDWMLPSMCAIDGGLGSDFSYFFPEATMVTGSFSHCHDSGDLVKDLGESKKFYDRMSLRGKNSFRGWYQKIRAMQASNLDWQTCVCQFVASNAVIKGDTEEKPGSGWDCQLNAFCWALLIAPRLQCSMLLEQAQYTAS